MILVSKYCLNGVNDHDLRNIGVVVVIVQHFSLGKRGFLMFITGIVCVQLLQVLELWVLVLQS